MIAKNIVKITNRGMVSIPAAFRKKYNLKDGNYVMVVEDEGTLRLIPIRSTKELQEMGPTVEEVLKVLKESRNEDLELEK